MDKHVHAGGHTFVDDEMTAFYDYFRKCLQKNLRACKREEKEKKQELNTCSNILGGKPSEVVSKGQASFRRDFQLVCEASGVPGCHLFLSDDCQFIDTVANSEIVRRIFKRCFEKVLGISPFDLNIKAIGEVIEGLCGPGVQIPESLGAS